MDSIAVLTGFVVAAAVGVSGVAADSLKTRLLIGVFGLSPGIAIGTHPCLAALTKGGGAIAHTRHALVDWGLLTCLLMGSPPGIRLVERLTSGMPERVVRTPMCASLLTSGRKVMT